MHRCVRSSTVAGTASETVLERAQGSRVARAAARSGFAASALVQLLVGIIAIRVGLTSSDAEADQSGAIAALAKQPGGSLLLLVAGAGAAALTLWLITSGVLAPGDTPKARWWQRTKDWSKAVVYGAIAVTAIRFTAGAGSSTAKTSRHGSATLLSVPGGAVLLLVIGVAVVASGVSFVVIGIRADFLKVLVEPRGAVGTLTVVLGRIGYIARGIAFTIVGVVVGIAAMTADPHAASGLDGALKSVQKLPYGWLLLTAVGAGWIASAAFTTIRVTQAKLD